MAVSGGTKSWSRLEPGKMPAWKQEVLERKRQKMASSGGAAGGRSSSPRGGKEGSPRRGGGSPERLVLQDSLGPLKENPFIKLEKERRRRRPQHHHHPPPPGSGRAASPIRQLLDIYSHVPGIRTIRADNIIIIESDPAYFKQTVHTAGAADPVEELLAKRGSKVAEIRASEVVIYEPEVSGSEPPKKSAAEPVRRERREHGAALEEAGRVSRLLEKFNQGHGRPARSRSWENLLEREHKPPLLPKPPTGQAPQNKAPRRSGETSPSSSILDEDGKRFPLNNPSWLPPKPLAIRSLPDPDLFHKRPSSPAPLSPLSPRCEESPVSPVVSTVREKFEASYTNSNNNNHSLSKPTSVTQRSGSNTILVNPKAAISKGRPPDSADGAAPLINGHLDHSEVPAGESIQIEKLLSKSRRSRGSSSSSEGSGVVPSPATVTANDILKGANDRKPKTEAVQPKTTGVPPKSSATLPESPLPHHHDQGFSSATPSQLMRVAASTSSNDSFEIRPAPKPDMRNIPDDDLQAKALANIRMQSKNSFVFVPKKRQAPSEPQLTKETPKAPISASTLNGPKLGLLGQQNGSGSKDDEPVDPTDSLKSSNVPSLSDFDWKSGLLPPKPRESQSFTDFGAELEYFSNAQQGDTLPVTKIHEDVAKRDIPVTNIDDVVSADDRRASKETTPAYRPHAALSSVRTKGPNTFTVVPKKQKPISEQEAFRTPVVVDEEDDEDAGSKRKSSDGSEAPYSELGALIKKRYPTADEIHVIGGYMSLSKSCLSKNGSTRKKMKISFNERNIHTMFEYPSENSLAEGEDEASDSESDEEDRTSGLMIPRASFGSGGGTSNGLRSASLNSGLSSYTPKHSLEYSKWQDEKTLERPSSPESGGLSEDMLTPADSNSHSDFRSEPALYF